DGGLRLTRRPGLSARGRRTPEILSRRRHPRAAPEATMKRKPCLVFALALLTAVPAAAEKPQVHAIVGARVMTVSGAVLESATLVLRDGVIQAVGPAVAVPPDARVIDGKGLTLTPGLIDGFSGLGLPAPSPRAPGAGPASPTPAPSPLAPQAMALDRLRPAEMQKARDTGVTTALVIP